MNVETISPDLDGSGLRIGIVQSRFNTMVTDGLRDVCATELVRLGVNADDILMLTVPGALEIPLVLQKLAETGGFDALIALGAVIRGETYHFELVSNEVASGISAVALSCGIPVINAVLTTNTGTSISHGFAGSCTRGDASRRNTPALIANESQQ